MLLVAPPAAPDAATLCPSCGLPPLARFCSGCGEGRVEPEDLTLRHFLAQAAAQFTSLEASAPRSLLASAPPAG